MIVDVSKSGIVLSIQPIIKLLKSREAASSIDPKTWPPILDIDDNPKRKLAGIATVSLDSSAYLDFSVSTCGRLSGVNITHRYEGVHNSQLYMLLLISFLLQISV